MCAKQCKLLLLALSRSTHVNKNSAAEILRSYFDDFDLHIPLLASIFFLISTGGFETISVKG
jgi:hypothetical protein